MAKDEHREAEDLDGMGEGSHAADEPTAVWDIEALRKAGLSELANLPDTPEPGPATPAEGMAQRPSIIVSSDAPPAAPVVPPAGMEQRPNAPVKAEAGGFSWWTLLALAVLIGSAAYAVIRFLR